MKKTILATLLAFAMCFVMSTSAFAETAEAESTLTSNVIGEATYLVSDDGITLVSSSGDPGIMPLSSVSGYNQATYGSGTSTLVIKCNGSGSGGMGITIQASCSYGDYKINFHGYAYNGEASSINSFVVTNNTRELHNLHQNTLREYRIEFTASGVPDYLVKVWIYG